MVIRRQRHLDDIRDLLWAYPVVAILGARQVGKTTLAAMVATTSQRPVATFDLENPADVSRLADPMLALETERQRRREPQYQAT